MVVRNLEQTAKIIFFIALAVFLLTDNSIEIVQKAKDLIINNIFLLLVLLIIILVWRARR